MTRNLYFILVSSILLLTNDLKAQEQYLWCPQSGFSTTATVPTTANQTTTTMISMGIYNSASAQLVAGNTYKLATDFTLSFNPVMTVFNNFGVAQSFDDDGGFLEDAEMYFTPLSTGNYSIQINEYGCGSGSGFVNLKITLVEEAQAERTIPVVVHVVHYGEAIGTDRNISDAQIHDQIAVLNADFSRSNADIILAPPVFRGRSNNTNIQFCLAQQDPNGGATDGIVRYDASSMTGGKPSWSKAECDSIIKPTTIWNSEDYLNIWVVDFDTSASVLLGYAQFPPTIMNTMGGFDPNTDGIVMNYKAFGTSPNNFPGYNVGRTLTHETGHYLGLWHTFRIPGDCTMDDECSDTPLQSDETFGCPTTWTPSICINFPAMSNNFMDYVNQDCMNMFTYRQAQRMNIYLLSDRSTLLWSNGCSPPTPIYGCIDPSACNYDASANTDDGSCDLPNGCGDPLYLEYSTSVTCSDPAACITLIVEGCTDETACNYDSYANVEDGSCDYSCYGCTDATACNYNSAATIDDGSCYNNVIASIMQDGDDLMAVTTPIGLNANWYNIQTEDSTTRIWLMEEDASSFTPTFECTYFIVVGDDNGCTDTSETYYFGATAARIGALTTSPNPTSGRVNVHFQNPRNQFVYLHLMNSNGVKLDDFITKNTELDIDISKYPSGTYYLHFNSSASQQGCNAEEVETISTKIILTK